MFITLTTDFGVSSPYVAAMKGALLSVCPSASLVDLTHAIAPQNVREAAVILADVTTLFPAGTLHMVVVDPGVGTARKIIYLELDEQLYLAPDNGVLSYLARGRRPTIIRELRAAEYWRASISNTFHGRDVFAPVAGHLASGVASELLGPAVEQWKQLPWPVPEFQGDEVRGEILYVDSFGNLITNVQQAELQAWAAGHSVVTAIKSHSIAGLHSTYGNGTPGELIALGDSQGRLELAVVYGNAAATIQARAGDLVTVCRRTEAGS